MKNPFARSIQRKNDSGLKQGPESGVVHVAGNALPYVIERSTRRTRTIAFTMTAQATLRIIAPVRTRLSTIHTLLDDKADSVLHDLIQRYNRTSKEPTALFVDGSPLHYMGHRCTLHITQDTTLPSSCRVKRRHIHINLPHADLSADALRDEAKLEFTLWLKKRTKIVLKKRMDVWAERMGVSYKRMVISSPEQQWGSCSVDNTIRLNWRLMLAPLGLMDYVVAHELSHCVHKNHSARFWRFLATVMPDYQARRRQLRLISSQLQF